VLVVCHRSLRRRIWPVPADHLADEIVVIWKA
jgi:hypothetical protein